MPKSFPVLLRSFLGWVISAFTILLGTAASASADEAAVLREIKAAFEDGWTPSIKGLKSAQAHFETAQQLSATDIRVPFAQALVLLQNRRVPEAARQLDEALLGRDKLPLLPIRRVRIYVAALSKDYAGAARQMRILAGHLAAAELTGEVERSYRESAQFLGNLVEYLAKQGESVRAAVAAEKKKSQDILDAEVAVLKTQEETNVKTEQDYRMKSEATRLVNEPLAKAAEAQISGVKGEINRLERESDSIKKKEENEIKTKIGSCERKIKDLEAKIDKAEEKAEKDKKKPDTRGEQRDVDKLKREITGLKDELRRVPGMKPLKKEIDKKESEIRQIEAGNPSIQFMRQYHSTLRKFASEKQDLVSKRAEAQDVQNNYDSTDNINPATNALIIKSKAFTSYIELSLDTEKDRILATYGSK